MSDFEWDPSKAASNLRKHGVDFRDAADVFDDPNQLVIFDEDHSEDERRFLTIGLTRQHRLIVVIHTFRQTEDPTGIRIISARPATRNERRDYELRR